VPNAFHAPLATAALEAGKHVILDKPFALYLAEALRVAEASRKSGRLFMLGTNQRFEEGPQKVKALAEKGYFGKIYHLKASWRRRSGIPRLGTWFGNRKLAGGGCLLDIGVHMINLALYVAGVFDAECVTGAVYTRFGNRGLGGGTWGASEPEAMPFDVDDFSKALVPGRGRELGLPSSAKRSPASPSSRRWPCTGIIDAIYESSATHHEVRLE